MAITIEGTPTHANGDGTDFTVAVPSVGVTIAAGDYIVVFAAHAEAEDNTWGVPTGMDGEWLSELQVGQTPPSVPGMQVFYELCSGGESGTRSSAGTFAGAWNVIAFVVRGVDGTTPLDVTVTTIQSTSTGDPDPPSITPANDDCAIMALGLKDHASTTGQTVTTWPTGYTDLQEEEDTATTTGLTMAIAINILTGGASTPQNPSAYVMSLAADEWAAASIALRPGVTVTYEQEGHQFRDDDGSESGATDLGAQDSDIESGKEENRRLRMLSDATGDPPSHAVTLQYRLVGDPASEWESVA